MPWCAAPHPWLSPGPADVSDRERVLFTPTNIAAFAILVGSCIWLGWWFYERSQYVYLDDARVASTMISIASRIPGWVTDLPVDEGQQVSKGELLVSIDARDTRLQLDGLKASLKALDVQYERKQTEIDLTSKQVETSIVAASSALDAARAGLQEAAITLAQSKKDLRRATSLLSRKMISDETYDADKTAYDRNVQTHDKAAADVESAKAGLQAARDNRQKLDLLGQDLLMIARNRDESRVEEQRLEATLSDCEIKSPVNGVVDDTFINQGEYVYPGQRILMLHDPDNLWIKANIKETEVRRVKVGSEVKVSVDALPGKLWHGTVSTIGTAATSQFAMLPAPNPSGNFTKITQRLELKVKLKDEDPELKPGMMVELQIKAN